MSDWKRTTREILFDGLSAEVMSAVNKHIELHNLGSILTDVLICIQTDSEKAKKGLFGKAEQIMQIAILAPRWLVWAVRNGSTPAAVLSAQLSAVTVQDYSQTQFAKMVPDSGVQVNGLFTGSHESASAFIGLGNETAAGKFKEILIKAVQDAKR